MVVGCYLGGRNLFRGVVGGGNGSTHSLVRGILGILDSYKVGAMTPSWYVTYAILALYVTNSAWLAALGNWWAAGYWVCAAGITICAMYGLAR
jgi:hypothetical protein